MNGLEDAVDIARATGDPTRMRILVALGERPLCVCELVALVDVGQPAVSRHLGILEDAGLVERTRNGRWVDYRLARPGAPTFAARVLRGVDAIATSDGEAADLRARAGSVDRRNLDGSGANRPQCDTKAAQRSHCVTGAENPRGTQGFGV